MTVLGSKVKVVAERVIVREGIVSTTVKTVGKSVSIVL